MKGCDRRCQCRRFPIAALGSDWLPKCQLSCCVVVRGLRSNLNPCAVACRTCGTASFLFGIQLRCILTYDTLGMVKTSEISSPCMRFIGLMSLLSVIGISLGKHWEHTVRRCPMRSTHGTQKGTACTITASCLSWLHRHDRSVDIPALVRMSHVSSYTSRLTRLIGDPGDYIR